MSYRVIIIQRRLTHYRVPLFDRLRRDLEALDIDLRLLVGNARESEKGKFDEGYITWAEKVKNIYMFGEKICWQPVLRKIWQADLVVLTHENALLTNHALLLGPRHFKIAFWGHGANFQSKNSNNLRERYKRWSGAQADWWFAYTELSVDRLKEAGFPPEKITCLNNATDVTAFQKDRASIGEKELEALRAQLAIGRCFTGVFIGSLYPEKRLEFLFEAADRVKVALPQFQLLVIGAGPQQHVVDTFSRDRPWVRYVGPRKGRQKVLYLALADVMLNPGLVGLNILDAFACGMPLLTTSCKYHSPEIAYLNASNGVMTKDTVDAYVEAIVSLGRDRRRLEWLRENAEKSAKHYTIEEMSSRFANGIRSAMLYE